jgi:hypothetical protein
MIITSPLTLTIRKWYNFSLFKKLYQLQILTNIMINYMKSVLIQILITTVSIMISKSNQTNPISQKLLKIKLILQQFQNQKIKILIII